MNNRLLLDTNVVIDIITKRNYKEYHTEHFLSLVNKNNDILCISASTITDVYYILSKKVKKSYVLPSIIAFCENTDILYVDKTVILNAFNSNFSDFEDSVQYYTAKLHHIDYIITRDKKGFKSSSIPYFSPKKFIAFFA